LTGYNPLRLRNNRATTPFAKVIIRLDRLQPPSLDNAYAMTQLKMQQQQHHIIILNHPQKIFISTQDHWKDKLDINKFHSNIMGIPITITEEVIARACRREAEGAFQWDLNKTSSWKPAVIKTLFKGNAKGKYSDMEKEQKVFQKLL